MTPDFLSVLFPMRFIGEAMSLERWVEIPEPVREIYKLWRPSPLHRAHRLEKALDTPADESHREQDGQEPLRFQFIQISQSEELP